MLAMDTEGNFPPLATLGYALVGNIILMRVTHPNAIQK